MPLLAGCLPFSWVFPFSLQAIQHLLALHKHLKMGGLDGIILSMVLDRNRALEAKLTDAKARVAKMEAKVVEA